MFWNKFFTNLYNSMFSRPSLPFGKNSILYIKFLKIQNIKKIWQSRYNWLYLLKENNKVSNMIEFPSNEQIHQNFIEILDEHYNILCDILDNKDRIKLIEELTPEQAKNVIDWSEELFISTYLETEEYEKCSRIKQLINDIKQIKKI